jgi:hypothetical protein
MFPAESTATHSEGDGQDSELSEARPSICATLHAPGAAAGFVEVSTLPEVSTPTQRDREGQDAADGWWAVLATWAAAHERGPPVGFAELARFPPRFKSRPALAPTATHKALE